LISLVIQIWINLLILFASCIDKIFNEEEVWASSDVTKKELIDFLDANEFCSIQTN